MVPADKVSWVQAVHHCFPQVARRVWQWVRWGVAAAAVELVDHCLGERIQLPICRLLANSDCFADAAIVESVEQQLQRHSAVDIGFPDRSYV